MKPQRGFAVFASAVIVGGLSVLFPTGVASAGPSNTGCPDGYQLLSVAALSAQGYMVPALVDSPTSGVVGHGAGKGQSWVQQPGNGDGWICARQLGNKLTPFGDPVYDFVDNQLPSSS